ncbi:RNA-binding motif x-linked related protein [Cyclospora cayetanensis]|uniref:RNA-binding motif x-linked related protein n=1 Tax=Cyclospora cayetanensis TaxID=88456 RepID=A0A1D3D272_9EIME|nr:RNA-binding motif x-linked related protein [Cyclospora cayetanensis]
MSLNVTGAFSNINAVQRLNAEELRLGISGEASWHHQYKDSCYIYIGGLDPRLTEGDVAIVFSQWGEPIDVVLIRDQKTGVPRGFGFLGYEDQRSTILAVDNANGMKLLQRTLRVDHCKDFRPPNADKEGCEYQPTGAEGAGIDKYLVTKREQQLSKSRQQQQRLQEQRKQQAMARAAEGGKDVDEMWAEEFELMLSKMNEQADAEVSELMQEDRRLKKKLKKEKKRLKKQIKKHQRTTSSRSSSRSSSSGRGSRSEDEMVKKEQRQSAREVERHSSKRRHSSNESTSSNIRARHKSRRDDSSSGHDHLSVSSGRRKDAVTKAEKVAASPSREASREARDRDPRDERSRRNKEKSSDRGLERERHGRKSRSRDRSTIQEGPESHPHVRHDVRRSLAASKESSLTFS